MLSHPLMVEAITAEFVPVVIHNNKKGRDLEVLKRYGEPTWNNPVVRFVDGRGKDILPRKDRVWSVAGVAGRMVAALRAAKREVPGYLALLAVPERSRFLQKATFAMY